jgi:hypothetical protein
MTGSPESETAARSAGNDAGEPSTALAASERLLRAVRMDEPTAAHREEIAALSESELGAMTTVGATAKEEEATTTSEATMTAEATTAEATTTADATATAFWLNCYNAATQLLLDDRPELYDSRWRFFRADALTVAGTALSLDDIEHGILRGKSKYGLGYVPRLFASRFERRHRLPETDPRIHFALNCGAASCPPIAAYSADVDAELDLTARGYLESVVEYDEEAETVSVPRLCLWFRGDFGGADGVREMLHEYEILPADATPTVRYLDWDWSRDVGAFAER